MKFSVITPSLNQAGYLPECVGSVRSQAGADVEVEHLVQDGGSTDGTVEWLREYVEKLNHRVLGLGKKAGPEITNQEPSALGGTQNEEPSYSFAYVSEKDEGQTDAINQGLSQATGTILAYLCADDLYEPGALARVAEIFSRHPEVDVVYGDYYFMEGDSGWKRRKTAGPYSVARLRRGNFLGQPSVFWRRRVMETHGLLDARLRYCMDHEYWLRLAGRTCWHYLPVVLATSRLHPAAKTSAQLTAMWEETAEMATGYGLGPLFQKKARAMRLYGAAYYTAKRRFFQWVGRRWLR